MTMKKELTSLDLEVKRMMLEHPSLFPSRMHCLEFLFCANGTGYRWQLDGTLKDYDTRSQRTARTPMPEHIAAAEPYDFGTCNGIMEESESVRLEYEGIVRAFREKHIDYLCSNNLHLNSELSFTQVSQMSWGYCNMSYAADYPHRIDDVWRNGIREFIHWFLPIVNGRYGCWSDSDAKAPNTERISDTQTNKNYIICQKVLKIMKTDEDRKQEKTLKKFSRKLLHEVITEEKE